MLLPAFFAYPFTSPTKLLSRTALSCGGLLATLVPLGPMAGVVGSTVSQNRDVVLPVAAVIVLAIGAIQVVGVEIPWARRGAEAKEPLPCRCSSWARSMGSRECVLGRFSAQS